MKVNLFKIADTKQHKILLEIIYSIYVNISLPDRWYLWN